MLRKTPLKRTAIKRKAPKPKGPKLFPVLGGYLEVPAPRSRHQKLGKEHMARVATLVCVAGTSPYGDPATRLNPQMVCCGGRTTVHHCIGIAFKGMGQKASDFETIPLCDRHHQNGPYAIHHMGQRVWEIAFGTQQEMLALTRERLQRTFPDFNPVTGDKYL